MSADVFISYRRKDSEFVSQLYQELTNRGVSAWFDKENIEVADHWRTSIAEGIRGCKVFVLVLSPDAIVSVNIRKEVDLAEKHSKPIVPLMWRQTDIPVAFEYALAGIQWIDFKETVSKENFDELADVINHLLGGASMAEAASDKETAIAAPIPAIQKEPAAAPTTGRRRLGGPKPKINPLVIQGLVISDVVTTFGLDPEEQDFLNGELKWLFCAVDHMIKVQSGEADINAPVPVDIPPEAEVSSNGDNKLNPAYNSRRLVSGLTNHLKNINGHLKNLGLLLEREVSMGEEARGNVNLQNQIKEGRLDIVKILKQIAELMNQAYGVKVTTPDQLLDLLEES